MVKLPMRAGEAGAWGTALAFFRVHFSVEIGPPRIFEKKFWHQIVVFPRVSCGSLFQGENLRKAAQNAETNGNLQSQAGDWSVAE